MGEVGAQGQDAVSLLGYTTSCKLPHFRILFWTISPARADSTPASASTLEPISSMDFRERNFRFRNFASYFLDPPDIAFIVA